MSVVKSKICKISKISMSVAKCVLDNDVGCIASHKSCPNSASCTKPYRNCSINNVMKYKGYILSNITTHTREECNAVVKHLIYQATFGSIVVTIL